MEEVIRVREVRKSMEQSRFFTPVCSPLVNNNNNHHSASSSGLRFQFPSSTPADRADLYMTLDVSSEQDSKILEEPEPEPVRKKSSGSTKPIINGRRKPTPAISLDSTVDSMDSSSAEILLTPEDPKGRVIHKRNQTLQFLF